MKKYTPLSVREMNTAEVCGRCQHLRNGECSRLVMMRDIKGRQYFCRLIRLSDDGAQCQLFLDRDVRRQQEDDVVHPEGCE